MSNPQLQYQYVSAPRAKSTEAGRAANIALVAVTPAVLDLTTLGKPASYTASQANQAQPNGAMGSYVTITADGCDIGLIFGTASADVSGANAPVLATVGTVPAGVYTPAAGECFIIKTGQTARFLLRPLPVGGSGTTAPITDQFLGFVGSGAGFMRIYQSSPAGLAAR